jgi:hypothetical protein
LGYFSERGLVHLRGLRNIEHVHLGWAVDVNDAVLEHLGTLPNLRELHVQQYYTQMYADKNPMGDPHVTDRGLAALAKLRRLEVLELTGVHVTNQGLRHLANFPELRRLNITSSNLSAQGLAEMPKLKHLGKPQFDRVDRGRIFAEPAAESRDRR